MCLCAKWIRTRSNTNTGKCNQNTSIVHKIVHLSLVEHKKKPNQKKQTPHSQIHLRTPVQEISAKKEFYRKREREEKKLHRRKLQPIEIDSFQSGFE